MVYPKMVYRNGEGVIGINYEQLIYVLVQVIQGSQEQIEVLKAEVNDMKNSGLD